MVQLEDRSFEIEMHDVPTKRKAMVAVRHNVRFPGLPTKVFVENLCVNSTACDWCRDLLARLDRMGGTKVHPVSP